MNGPFPGLAELAPLAPEIALGLLGYLVWALLRADRL